MWWIAAAAVPLLAWAGWLALRPRPVPLLARFRLETVAQGDVLREVRATGRLEAVTTVAVGAEISGKIVSVEVDYNDAVKAGQVLARFDRASLSAQLQQVEGTLSATRAALDQSRTDRDKTNRDLARAEQLFAQKILAASDRDAAADAARLAAQRVTAAEAQLAAQQAAASVARTNLDHAVIRSPITGIVITRNVDPGQTVASMLQTPQLFVVAADLRKMRVVAAVDEADVGELTVRQHATFTVNAYPDRVFEGIVTEIRNSPVVVQDVVTYGTVVQVDNKDLALKPGMTASVRIRTAEARGVLHVPNAALHFAPPGERATGAASLWVVENGVLRRIAVTPGLSDDDFTAIAPGPLAAGARVIVDLTPEGRRAYANGG